MKEGDATIAAFAEWQNVDFFISENRHIYQELKVEAFITCNAGEFMKNLNNGKIWRMLHDFRASIRVLQLWDDYEPLRCSVVPQWRQLAAQRHAATTL